MNRKISTALGFVLIAGIVYGGYRILSWIAGSIQDVDPSIVASLIAGTATVISSVFIASYHSRRAKEKVAFEAHREKKAEIYNEYMEMVIQLMRNTKAGKEGEAVLPDNVEEFFYNFTAKVTVYGGPGVVKAYSEWRTASADGDSGGRSLLLVDKLFREMRKDLGESNKGIAANELLGLYIIGGKSEVAKAANKAINADS